MTKREFYNLLYQYQNFVTKENVTGRQINNSKFKNAQSLLMQNLTGYVLTISEIIMSIPRPDGLSDVIQYRSKVNHLNALGNRVYSLQEKINTCQPITENDFNDIYEEISCAKKGVAN